MSELKIAAELGATLEYAGRPMRIVRIINHSLSLFQNDEGEATTVDESYLELRDAEGKIEFHILHCDVQTYLGQLSDIKAPDPLPILRRS